MQTKTTTPMYVATRADLAAALRRALSGAPPVRPPLLVLAPGLLERQVLTPGASGRRR